MTRTHRDDQRPAPLATDEPLEGHYFVSTYPPFSTWTADRVADAKRMLNRAPTASPDAAFGLYVHIPFCMKRCRYCYYLAYTGRSLEQIDGYLDTLVDELAIYRRSPALAERDLSFVYFGGGTPSLLHERSLARMIDRLQSIMPWSKAKEVTFECAPKTVNECKLRILKDSGVTRLSLGVQIMDDEVLRSNGRVHFVSDVEQAYAEIRKVGFPVVNIDLIVGLIGETDSTFFGSLDRVLGMQPDSVTIYQLEIPHNTPLYAALRCGGLDATPASWEEKRHRLAGAFARLEEHGYHVRSAYAAVRDPVRHPFVYQDAQYHGADLLGLGVSSFSYIDGVHFQNVTSNRAYVEKVRTGSCPIGRAYTLSDDERLVREFVLQLKLGRADAKYFSGKFGVDLRERFRRPLDQLARLGWLSADAQGITVTRVGLLRVDRLLANFYHRCHKNKQHS
ncbi:MAG: coproporphyrinogen III oxidase family protein [Planctomycetes bacterium]|nr:coproporphyrinogen III oxidase family protein [Planctomycetota bacterium]